VVFADDWGRHPSSCQHLVRHLLGRHDVTWVNTIMRPPRLELATVRRGWEKARQWLKAGKAPAPDSAGPRVLNPRMWPWFSSSFSRRLNRRLLGRQLEPIVRSLPAPTVAITTLPIVADLIGVLPVQRWVYYCVDDFSVWPGLDGDPLRHMEERLVGGVDEVIAVSETLRDKMAELGRSAQLLTHGIDLDFWRRDCSEGSRIREDSDRSLTTSATGSLPAIDGLARPLIVFWGVIDRRMDIEFLRQLSADLDGGTIVLVGPLNDPEPELLRLPKVVHLGPVRFEQLPTMARAAAVLIMPYADLPVTRAIQPLKLKEYLATGKPVVVRDLPATREWSDCLDLAETPIEFSRTVRQRLHGGLPNEQRGARRRVEGETWAAKAEAFEQWICPREPEPVLA
jgi:glycosyltransferase involved in cell wall biosynthesis